MTIVKYPAFKITLLVAITFLASGLFYMNVAKPEVQTSISSKPQKYKPGVTEFTESEIISKLTSHRWLTIRDNPSVSDGYQYEFFVNGTFRYKVLSDYEEQRIGQWNYRLFETGGMLFLLDQTLTFAEALRFDFQGEYLILAGDSLTQASITTMPGAENKNGSSPNILNGTIFADYFKAISFVWTKSDLRDDEFVPDQYHFREGGVFMARYRDGHCTVEGYWSWQSRRIILEIPEHTCDLRGRSNGQKWILDVRFTDDSLIVNDKYIYYREPL